MAEYDFITGLTRILESKERQEQTRLQTSLAMMEMAQRRKIQSFEMITKQLEIGTAANKTLQLKVAGRFLDDTGLSALIDIDYSTPKDKMDTPDLNGAVSKLKKGKWGKFSDSDAQRIVSAVWLFRASQDPTNVIEIMSDMRNEMETGEGELYKSYKRGVDHKDMNLRAFEGIDDITWQAQESIRIGDNIEKELREVAEGDFRIDSDLGLDERLPPELPPARGSLAAGYSENVIGEIKDKNEQIRQIQASKRTAELEESKLQSLVNKGLATDEDRERLLSIPGLMDDWDEEISVIQTDQAKIKASADALAELEIRELLRGVGLKGTEERGPDARAGEKMLQAFAKGGTFDLLGKMPDDLVAAIIGGDKSAVVDHNVMGTRTYFDELGQSYSIDESEYNSLIELSETIRSARDLEAGFVKSETLPYEPYEPGEKRGIAKSLFPIPQATGFTGGDPGDLPEDVYDDWDDPITKALIALESPQGLSTLKLPEDE